MVRNLADRGCPLLSVFEPGAPLGEFPFLRLARGLCNGC